MSGTHKIIPDLDIDRSAQSLVTRHGNAAPFHASMRADAILERGDLDGLSVWKWIIRAVGVLLVSEAESVHCE